DMGDFVPARLPLADGTSDVLKRCQEEGLNEVRLELSCFGSLHLITDVLNIACSHDVADERTLVDHLPERLADRGIYNSMESMLDLGLLTVSDSIDEQVAEAPAAERLAEYVEDLISERLTLLVEFLEQALKNLAFACVLGHKVPEMTDLCLSDP